MAKPIIKPIPAFDATQDTSISFVWNGNAAYNNRLLIYDADTQGLVYEHEYDDKYYALNHELPANTLGNNKKYAAQIEVLDVNGTRSAPSDKLYFWTAVTPKIHITSITDKDVINTSSLNVEVQYDNVLTEPLIFVRYHLYDSNKRILTETDEDRSCSLSHTFKALANDTSYYVRVSGLTAHGMEIDTGYLAFSVSYRNPNSYARIYTDNDPRTGFIHYKSNIVVISPNDDNFNYDVGYIDLTDSKSNAVFNIKTLNTPSELFVEYTDNSGLEQYLLAPNGSIGLAIEDYDRINNVRVFGYTDAKQHTNLGEQNPLIGLKKVIFEVNSQRVEHSLSGFELRSLPVSVGDYYEVDRQGHRRIVSNVGHHRFTLKDAPVLQRVEDDVYVSYYNFGGKQEVYSNDLYCDGIAVDVEDQTSISIDPKTGYIKIVWRSDSNVHSDEQARQFFNDHAPCILFPLSESSIYALDPLPLPDMTTQIYLRYSNNFTIPWNASAFVFKVKHVRANAEIFKVSKGNKVCFVVSSCVNSDDELRFKLTVFGEGGSNSVQYSEPVSADYLNVIYVAIKRHKGLYGLYVSTDVSDEQTAGLWLTDTPPTYGLKPHDSWFDLDVDSVYVDTIAQTIKYQAKEPTEAAKYTVWIGSEV